jgi:CheY-like chemotaxis protein
MKMLFMDDDRDFLRIQTELFRRDGYEVVDVKSPVAAEEALKLHGEAFDIAVLDMNASPEMEAGLRIARKIHDNYASVSSLVLTAYGATDSASRCMLEDICAYVSKSEKEALLSGLRHCIKKRIGRLRGRLERAFSRWWVTSVEPEFTKCIGGTEREALQVIAKYSNLLCERIALRPVPDHRSQKVTLFDLLKAADEKRNERAFLYDSETERELKGIHLQTDLATFPDPSPVLRCFGGCDGALNVKIESHCGSPWSRVSLCCESWKPDYDSIARLNALLRGECPVSSLEAAAVLWGMQVLALCGLPSIRVQGADIIIEFLTTTVNSSEWVNSNG